MSEASIIDGLIRGDENTFREFVESWKQMVVNTCFGLVHSREDAEDIAQEVFIEVFRSVHKFRGQAKISTWLYRIAVTRSLNFIRDNKKRKSFQSYDAQTKAEVQRLKSFTAGIEDNPGFIFENKQRALILHKAISSLPENQRVAFILNKYEDLSQQEIADIMELTVSSVESLLYRAKMNLRKRLYKWYKKKWM